MRLALTSAVPLRTRIAKTLLTTAIVFGSLVAVGITAPAEAPFTITFRPVLANIGFDVDVKVWRVHVHFAWSAISSTSTSTKIDVTPL